MDLGVRRHYVAPAMEFLLILSAMLSAVTGAFTGARAPEARLHHEQAVERVAPAPRVAAASVAAAIPASAPVAARIEALPPLALAAAIPLYADRLIE